MRVRVEHLEQPLGIGDRRPRLSWQLPDGAAEQVAYELRRRRHDLRPGGLGATTCSCPGRAQPLSSRERRQVRVRVWTDRGESAWSEPTALEAGLLEPADWVVVLGAAGRGRGAPPGLPPGVPAARRGRASTGRWSRPGSTSPRTASTRPGSTAHRVGDLELAPGFTEYADAHPGPDLRRHRTWSREGGNVARAPCWPTGGTAARSACCARTTSSATAPRCSPSCTSTTRTAPPRSSAPAPGWTSTPLAHPGRRPDRGAGRGPAARRRRLGPPGFDDAAWDVGIAAYGFDQLVASAAPPVRAVAEIRPVAVTTPAPGRQVFDLGQNINGRVRLSRPRPGRHHVDAHPRRGARRRTAT